MIAALARCIARSLAMLAVTASVVACGDKALQEQQIAENARKVTADSTHDATESIVDEGYRFRLDWPGEGWKLLGPEDAARLVPDAVAGATAEGVHFVVIVERLPGATVDQVADLLLENPDATDLEVESRTSITFVDHDARRIVSSAHVAGIAARYVSTLFIREGYCYQLIGWGVQGKFAAAQIEPVLQAFSLIPGEVIGRDGAPAIDRDGPGWRIAGGVFESAVSGLRVAPADGWKVRVGAELEALSDDAEVALENAVSGAYVAISPERISPVDAAAFVAKARSSAAAEIEAAPAGTWKTDVFGRPTTFTRFSVPPLEMTVGAVTTGEYGFSVLAWYPAESGDAVRPALVGALAGITVLEPEARVALRDRLSAVPDTTSHVGLSHALRNGTFREFAAGLIWRRPAGFWRLRGGDQATTDAVVESLAFENVETGVTGHVAIVEREDDNALRWHEERVEMRGGAPGRHREVAIGSATALVSDVIVGVDGLDASVRVATVIHGAYGIEIVTVAYASRIASVREDVEAALGGLELVKELPEISVVDGEHRDQRFGFAVRVPQGWPPTEETPTAVAALMSIRLWKHDRSEIRVFAFDGGAQPTESGFAAARMEQNVREKLTSELGAATRGTASLGTLKTDHSTWTKGFERAEWLLASRNDAVFAILATNVDEDVLEDVLRSFRMLE